MLLKTLTELNGVTGNEDAVRNFIKSEAEKYTADIRIDSIGNVIAFKKGTNSKFKVMLSAHMDEVGLIVTGHSENGTVRFRNVGGFDERILPGKRVLIGDKKIPGVIGCKSIHLQEKDERDNNIRMKNMYIDVGAESKEEAEKLAPLGEYIAFDSEYVEFGEDCIKAKALDDRVGCCILLEALKGTYQFDLYCCFTVQEEIGLRGSEVASYIVEPDLALVVETTTCSDVPGARKQEYSTVMGNGAALTVMDGSSYADKKLVEFLYHLALKRNIQVQFKQTTTGGNDAGKIQRSRSGVKVAPISVPCRYIHSPVSVMNRKDYECCRDLVLAALDEFNCDQEKIETIQLGGRVDV